MSAQPKVIVGLGELLWDLLPGGKQLGRRAGQFSGHVGPARQPRRRLPAASAMTALGRETRKYLAPLPADPDSIQEDAKHPTGSVGVTNTAGPGGICHP